MRFRKVVALKDHPIADLRHLTTTKGNSSNKAGAEKVNKQMKRMLKERHSEL